MFKRIIVTLVPCWVLVPAIVVLGQGRSENDRSRAHVESARLLAGTELTAPFEFYCIPGNARGTGENPPELEPVRLFDNLYVAGNSETTVHAITTSEGIILIDSGHAGKVETVLVPGLLELGLNPANVRYILLGHGHADHYGGAAYFQEKYGTRVALSEADWDLIEQSPAGSNSRSRPKRDLVIKDAQPIELRDITITPVLIPGHTPGSVAFIFAVDDDGATRMAGLFGGTMLSSFLRSPTRDIEQYIDSIARYLEVAESMNVEVEVQNHPLFDDTSARLERLKARQSGQPHPFVMSNENYLRFWRIISECMLAEIAMRDDAEQDAR